MPDGCGDKNFRLFEFVASPTRIVLADWCKLSHVVRSTNAYTSDEQTNSLTLKHTDTQLYILVKIYTHRLPESTTASN